MPKSTEESPILPEHSEITKTEKVSLKKRLLKLKLTRRKLERSEKIATRHAKKFILNRLDNLRIVKNEIVGWLVLVGFLIILAFVQAGIYNQQNIVEAPVDGGTYAEGVVDKIGTISPLYAGTDKERAVSKLVYTGLFDYDDSGNLRPELASSYSVGKDGKTYTVKLRDNVRWSDGKPFGADDVILTVKLMKDPKTESILENSWKTVEIKKIDDATIEFTLKNTFASFPFALTFGILPNHILKNVSPASLRSFLAEDTEKIVGTGAFVYRSSEILPNGYSKMHFLANENYYRGEPRLKSFDVQTYATSKDLLNGFDNKEINAAAGLGAEDALKAVSKPDSDLVQDPMSDGVFALFNNSGAITGDKTVRQALRLATDRDKLRSVAALGDGKSTRLDLPKAMETPIIKGNINGINELKQPNYNMKTAAEKLDSAGWKLNANKMREKDGQVMTLNVVTIKGTDYERVAKALSEQWRELGIKIDLVIADSEGVQQNYFVTRNYDVLIYQLHIGSDPDVFAYWGSSQANARGLNLANYKSTLSDLALSNARSQLDNAKRDARYTDFVERWIGDAPAIALYRPNFYYLKSSSSKSLDSDYKIVDVASRYSDVQAWTVQTAQLKKTP